MKLILTRIILFSLPILFLTNCNFYPDSETRAEDTDIVITRYEPDADFSLYNTYSIVDEIYPIDADTTEDPDPIDNSAYILDLINDNMQSLGYEIVADNLNPDVRIGVMASTFDISFYYNYYDYWYWYGGGWGGWGGWWGYPPGCCYYGPPYYPVVQTYEIGTLFIDMVYSKDYTPGDTAQIVWNSTINGLLEGTSGSIQNRIKTSIDQAFDQSPYLSTSN